VSYEQLGRKLRKARLDNKLRFPDIQEKAKIQTEYLKRMENGEFDFFPSPVIIGFIKGYAQVVGLEQDELVRLYHKEHAQSDEGQETSKPRESTGKETPPRDQKDAVAKVKEGRASAPAKSEKEETPKPAKPVPELEKRPARAEAERKRGWLATHRGEVILGVLVLLIIAGIIYVYVQYGDEYFGQKAEPVERISVFQAKQQQLETAAAQKPVVEPIRLPEVVRLRVVAAETTWVRMVRDVTDTSEYTFPPGTDRSFEADQSIELRMGRADGLLLWINSDSLGALGTAAEIVRKLVITPRGVAERELSRPVAVSQ
jgi:cytoskeletal protein RodZ